MPIIEDENEKSFTSNGGGKAQGKGLRKMMTFNKNKK